MEWAAQGRAEALEMAQIAKALMMGKKSNQKGNVDDENQNHTKFLLVEMTPKKTKAQMALRE